MSIEYRAKALNSHIHRYVSLLKTETKWAMEKNLLYVPVKLKELGVLHLSLRHKLDCPSQTSWCKANCYGGKGWCNSDGCHRKQNQLSGILRNEIRREVFVAQLAKYLPRNKVLRLNATGGDLVPEMREFILELGEIRPDLKMFTFTRMGHLPEVQEFIEHANCTITHSADPTREIDWSIGNMWSTIVDHTESGWIMANSAKNKGFLAVPCRKQPFYRNPIKCIECKLCFTEIPKNKRRLIIFAKH